MIRQEVLLRHQLELREEWKLELLPFFLQFIHDLYFQLFQHCLNTLVALYDMCYVQPNHIVLIQMLLKCICLSDFKRRKEFFGIAATAIIGSQHICSH